MAIFCTLRLGNDEVSKYFINTMYCTARDREGKVPSFAAPHGGGEKPSTAYRLNTDKFIYRTVPCCRYAEYHL